VGIKNIACYLLHVNNPAAGLTVSFLYALNKQKAISWVNAPS
jgi:hypothetical protein